MAGSKMWVGKARGGLALLCLLALGVGLAYLAVMRNVKGGRPVAPLDDSYIFYQYARQIAQGQPWQYNSGDPPSTGMTSLLYPWLLAGLYRLGVQGERLVLVAVASGLLWLPAIAFATLRVWGALDISTTHSNRWGLIAALIVLTTGLVQWGAFLGMETGLFTLLLLLALDALLRQRTAWAAVWLGLAGLTRPEGLILALLTLVIYVAASWRERASSKSSWPLAWIPLGAAAGVGLVPLLVNWLLTGTPSAMGLQAKSWFYNVPLIWGDVLQSVLGEYRIMLLRTFNGWDGIRTFSTNLVAPGLMVLALVGWGILARQRRGLPFLLTAAWFWVGALSTATLITANWHLGRYQVPFIPLIVILAVSGLAAVWQAATSRWDVRRVSSGLLLFWLLIGSLLSTQHALSAFRQATGTVARQQLVLADWMRANLPPDARVGVHDTGSLRYVGERPTYDVVGLTTAETTLAWRNGSGSLFEQMEHSPRRPDYFAIYPDVFSVPYLAATDLFARELFRVEAPDYAIASASAIQGVWQADWRLAGSGELFYQADILERTHGLRQVDALDVADLHDEAAHHLRWWHDRRWPGFPTEVQQMRYHAAPQVTVLDGGRLVSGGMSFQVKTQPKEPLWMVARLHAREAGSVRVFVNGRDVGRWAYPAVPGEWLETLFAVPSDAVLGDKTEIRLQVDSPSPDFRHYAPYYLWFLQGEPGAPSGLVRHPLDVVFDSHLRLLGYDLAQAALHPGETLSVTLYWQATAPTASAAKVFVHLYDAQGRLGPQVDGWPTDGTRPPYTWSVGEVIRDPCRVLLPLELSPGHYSLQVGLYDEGGRLAASSVTMQPFFENRVPVAEIEVKSP
jgi:hypothetical protein